MKKQILSAILTIAMMFTATVPALAASNQPSSWAAQGIARANELNLVTDEMNKNFQSPTTRAEFCRLIARFLIIWYDAPIDYIVPAFGLEPVDFNDTNEYMIRAAAALGITSGTGNGNFSPDATLTREQAAGMLRNTLTAIGVDTANPTKVAWADEAEISAWAREATDVMYAAKIMSGTGTNPLTFSPKSPYTHEQAVITVLNLWDYAISQNVSRTLPEDDVEYGKQTQQSAHQYDMSDPNVKKHPIYVTAKTAEELVKANPNGTSGGWRFTAERLAAMKNDDPDYMIDGKTFYDWRMKPIQKWVDAYIAANGLSYKNKTDYEKTAIIKHIVENGRLEEFIGLWRSGFQFTSGDCVPVAEAVDFLMLSMSFELFVGIHCTWGEAHATNAYWDSIAGGVRFVDAGNLSSWNCFVDELDEWNFILD